MKYFSLLPWPPPPPLRSEIPSYFWVHSMMVNTSPEANSFWKSEIVTMKSPTPPPPPPVKNISLHWLQGIFETVPYWYILQGCREVQGPCFYLVSHREQSINWTELTFSRTFNTGLSQLSSAYPLLTVENQTKQPGPTNRPLAVLDVTWRSRRCSEYFGTAITFNVRRPHCEVLVMVYRCTPYISGQGGTLRNEFEL